MNVMTSAEAAKLWNISQRQVQEYCKSGKIKGAIMMSDRWFVPKNAIKPEGKVGRPRKSTENGT